MNLIHLLPKESEIEAVFDRLWPICRSLTGQGFEKSLDILSSLMPIERVKTPSGTAAFDWVVPPEWNIRDAYIVSPNGEKIAEFSKSNLHVVNYSTPVDKFVDFEELKSHLHTLPELPDAIPYRTSYYQRNWGFCLDHNTYLKLKPGQYRVFIDSTLEAGFLTYGHAYLPANLNTGNDSAEILISSYLCHPSMANNELSGPIVAAFLFKALQQIPARRFNYRFVWVPETIGSIVFLSQKGEDLKKSCHAGLVATCCGDAGAITYKKSRKGNALIDRMVENVLKHHGKPYQLVDFFPLGSDERQYCSPGFNLPVGSLMRTMYGKYPEYHTSLDNKNFISFAAMRESIELYLKVCLSLELNGIYRNKSPFCEPMLGKRGLYPPYGEIPGPSPEDLDRIRYLLAYSDGQTDLLAIAESAKCSVLDFFKPIEDLVRVELLERIHDKN